MKKRKLLQERFQQLAGIKPLYTEQRDVCAQLQATNSSLYDYCLAHCGMQAGAMPMPPECPSDFASTCCPGIDHGCPEGMIDDTHPDWGDCVKCGTNGTETSITGPDCECCRPMDDEPEGKLTCYRCNKKNQQVQAIQFPNSLSAWANFNFQGECPKGWTTDPDPCR